MLYDAKKSGRGHTEAALETVEARAVLFGAEPIHAKSPEGIRLLLGLRFSPKIKAKNQRRSRASRKASGALKKNTGTHELLNSIACK